MNSIRNHKYVLATLALAAFALLGCSKDAANKDGETTPGAAKGASPVAKSAFAVFPRDTNLVFGINLSEVSSSNFYKSFLEPQIKAQTDKEFAQFQAECGFDPLAAIKGIVVGSTMSSTMEPAEDKMLVVVQGLTRTQVTECAQKLSKKEDSGVEVSQDGKFTKMVKDGETMWIGWIDDATMVTGPKADKAMLEARMGGADGLSGNKEMMDILGSTDQKSGIWLGMKKPEGAEAPGGVNFSAAFASVKLSGGLNLDAGIRQGSADEASTTVTQAKAGLEMMKTQAGLFGKYFDKVQMSSKGNDVIVQMSLNDAELQEIVQALGPMMGMMMGGGF